MRRLFVFGLVAVLGLVVAGQCFAQKHCSARYEVGRHNSLVYDAVSGQPVPGVAVDVWDNQTRKWHGIGKTNKHGKVRGTYSFDARWRCNCRGGSPECFRELSFKTRFRHPLYQNQIVKSMDKVRSGDTTSRDSHNGSVHLQRDRNAWERHHRPPPHKHGNLPPPDHKHKHKKKKKKSSRPGIEIKTKGVKAKITF